jgi:DNA-binding NarL/FixJ family response regulator
MRVSYARCLTLAICQTAIPTAQLVNATILLADDHNLITEGVSALLGQEFRLLGREVDGRTIVDKARLLRPDVVILDISMPGASGLDAARRIHEMDKRIRIVMLTQHTEWAYAHAAFEAGASAYVVKSAAASELRRAILLVLGGRSYVSPSMDRRKFPSSSASASGVSGKGLSLRQSEILKLIASGRTAKEISTIFQISVKTVEYHKAVIMKKLELRTTAELAVYAYQQGLVN